MECSIDTVNRRRSLVGRWGEVDLETFPTAYNGDEMVLQPLLDALHIFA